MENPARGTGSLGGSWQGGLAGLNRQRNEVHILQPFRCRRERERVKPLFVKRMKERESGESPGCASRGQATRGEAEREAHVAQLAEHVLGKDEVTRSIRVVGSTPCWTRYWFLAAG